MNWNIASQRDYSRFSDHIQITFIVVLWLQRQKDWIQRQSFQFVWFLFKTTITSSSRIHIGIVCCWQNEQLCTLGIIVLGHDTKPCNFSSSIGLKNFVSCLISGYSSSDKRILNFLTLLVTFQLPYQRNVGTRMPTLTFDESYQEFIATDFMNHFSG